MPQTYVALSLRVGGVNGEQLAQNTQSLALQLRAAVAGVASVLFDSVQLVGLNTTLGNSSASYSTPVDGTSPANAPQLLRRLSLAQCSAQTMCAAVPEGDTLTMTCPSVGILSAVVFASLSAAPGSCEAGYSNSSCSARATDAVTAACFERHTCSIAVNASALGGACGAAPLVLTVQLQCSAPRMLWTTVSFNVAVSDAASASAASAALTLLYTDPSSGGTAFAQFDDALTSCTGVAFNLSAAVAGEPLPIIVSAGAPVPPSPSPPGAVGVALGPIIGGIAAAVALLGCAAGAAWLVRKRRRRAAAKVLPDPPAQQALAVAVAVIDVTPKPSIEVGADSPVTAGQLVSPSDVYVPVTDGVARSKVEASGVEAVGSALGGSLDVAMDSASPVKSSVAATDGDMSAAASLVVSGSTAAEEVETSPAAACVGPSAATPVGNVAAAWVRGSAAAAEMDGSAAAAETDSGTFWWPPPSIIVAVTKPVSAALEGGGSSTTAALGDDSKPAALGTAAALVAVAPAPADSVEVTAAAFVGSSLPAAPAAAEEAAATVKDNGEAAPASFREATLSSTMAGHGTSPLGGSDGDVGHAPSSPAADAFTFGNNYYLLPPHLPSPPSEDAPASPLAAEAFIPNASPGSVALDTSPVPAPPPTLAVTRIARAWAPALLGAASALEAASAPTMQGVAPGVALVSDASPPSRAAGASVSMRILSGSRRSPTPAPASAAAPALKALGVEQPRAEAAGGGGGGAAVPAHDAEDAPRTVPEEGDDAAAASTSRLLADTARSAARTKEVAEILAQRAKLAQSRKTRTRDTQLTATRR